MRALLSWQWIDAQHGWHAERASDADGMPVTLLLGPEQAAPTPFSAAIPSWLAETARQLDRGAAARSYR